MMIPWAIVIILAVFLVFLFLQHRRLISLMESFLRRRETALQTGSGTRSVVPFHARESIWLWMTEVEHEEEKQRSDALHTAFLLQVLLNGLAEGILLLDASGKVQLINRSLREMMRLEEPVRGLTLLELLRNPSLHDLFQRALKEKKVLQEMLEWTQPVTGEFDVRVSSVLDEQGKVIGHVLVFQDQTRLRHLEKSRKDFVADISHEIRTPLSILQGYVETLESYPQLEEEQRKKFLGIMSRHVDRISALINDLLKLSHLESGKGESERRDIQISEIIQTAVQDFEGLAASRKMRILADISASLPVIFGDVSELRQVVNNLIDNALKYSEDGTEIRIAAALQGEVIRVAVLDQGVGIPEQDLPHIFERFYRVEKSRSRGKDVQGREQGGTGLGLSIVREIVRRHGGRVWAESGLGVGSKFVFELPWKK